MGVGRGGGGKRTPRDITPRGGNRRGIVTAYMDKKKGVSQRSCMGMNNGEAFLARKFLKKLCKFVKNHEVQKENIFSILLNFFKHFCYFGQIYL
jgi:hypothetical protein